MQTTLLAIAIAIIVAIVAALAAPLVVDWNHFRATFETEASRFTGLRVHVNGAIDARILPSPRIKLRDVEIGAPDRAPLLRAGAIDLEVRLSPLIRGDVQATQANLVAPQIDLELDRGGAVVLPAMAASARPGELSVSKLSVDGGTITLADAASGARLQLQKLSFAGDVRSLLGPFQGQGSFVVGGESFSYRVAGGHVDDANSLKIRLSLDPSDRALTVNLDGTLGFERGTPQFEGTLALARPVGVALASGERVMNDPWQAGAAIHATPAAATLKDVVFQYGPDERAVNFTGKAELAFGDRPHFDGELSALEVNVDRALAAPDVTRRPPLLVLKSFVETMVPVVRPPLPGKLRVGIAGLTLGGTTVQSLRGTVGFDDAGWNLDDFELHAPGATAVTLSGRFNAIAHDVSFSGPGAVEAADADTLLAWLGGRGGQPSGEARVFRALGDVGIAGNRLAVDRLAVTLDREKADGRFAYTWPTAGHPAVVEADLHATKLDLDALTAFAQTAVGQNGFELPRQGSLALDLGRATLGGVDARGVNARAKFDAGALQIERLSIGELGGGAFDIAGRIDELSSQPRGHIAVDVNAATIASFAPLLGRLAPRAADALRRASDRLAPAKLHATLTVDRAAAGSSAKLDLDGQLGLLRLIAAGNANGAPSHLGDTTLHLDSRLDADDGTALTALFGIDRIVGVDQLPGRATLSLTGPLNGDMRVDGEVAASGLTAAARGMLHVSGNYAPGAALQVLATAADLRPLQQAMTGQAGEAVSVSARAAVAIDDTALSLTQIAVAVGKASVRGRLTVNPTSPANVDGELAADNVDGAWLTAMLLGIPGQALGATGWSSRPASAGAFAAMNGMVRFTLDHTAFTPALVANGLKGVAQFRGNEIALNEIDGSFAGGHLAGTLAFRRDAEAVSGRGHVALSGADAAKLLGNNKRAIDAKLTVQSVLDSIGTSAAALIHNLHGGGTVAVADAHIAGFDPAAFAAAMRVADQGTAVEPAKIAAIDGAKVQAAVEAAMAGGRLTVPQGEATLTVTNGRVGVANATLPAQDGATLSLAGALDLGTGAVDARMTLSASPPPHALIGLRPEFSVALKGPLAAPARTLEVSALTGWLTLRAAELQTRRLESIEANSRVEVIGRAVRPEPSAVPSIPAGRTVEAEPAVPAIGMRGLELLQPDGPPGAATGTTTAKPQASPPAAPAAPATPPAAPRTAAPTLPPPLNLLFGPEN